MSWPLPVSLLIAALVAWRVQRLTIRRSVAIVGAAMIAAALVLYRVTPRGTIDLSIGLVLGVGAGTVAAIRHSAPPGTARRRGTPIVIAGAVLTVALVAWVGCNDPTVQWFGHVVTHGSRTDPRVAITFDDGPDDPFTLQISAVMDAHGVKGTFFEVGKAVDARPDIARSLLADGHLLGNHSFHHDYWRWLDPRYPELDRTQDAFRTQLGVCPAFFRPPHGQRTPFMLAHVSSKGMHTVTWDVSASDWTSTDGQAVARGILDHVKPGSIVLLHDGLDGTVTADRTVLLEALPLILDGLRAKGLQPVRLDELLGQPGYLSGC